MERRCPSCGAEARAGDHYCGACGRPLEAGAGYSAGSRSCPRCGAPLDAGDRFCGACGAAVAAERPTMAADLFGDAGDPLAESGKRRTWREEPPAPRPASDEAPTESIPPVRRVEDTAVLPHPPPVPAQPVPAGEPAVPAPAAAPRGRFPLGATLALLGAMAVLFSALLQWAPAADGGPPGAFPRDIPFRRLLDVEAVGPGISLGLVLLVAGVTGALLALLTMVVPALKFLRRIVGVVALAVVVLFAVRALPSIADAGRITEFLGVGVYVAGGGALLQILAGRWFRR